MSWKDAARLVASCTGETGMLFAAFRDGALKILVDALPDSPLTLAEVQQMLGPSTSGVIHNPHPLEPHAEDQTVENWLQLNRARVKRADVDRLWPNSTPPSAGPSPAAARQSPVEHRRPGGRPLVHDWAAAAAFAVAYMLENDPKQVVLVKALTEWFARKEKQPDNRAIERFVSLIFQEISDLQAR